jgi:hypothetical protein
VTPTVAKVAKQIYESGGIDFSKDDRRMILVPSLDGNKRYHVNLPLCEFELKNCAHLFAFYFHCGFEDDFGTPTKVIARCVAGKPKHRRAKAAPSGRKAPRKTPIN